MEIDQYLGDEEVLAELGARLERARLERNLTQRQLAAAAGVGRMAVQRIEGGQSVTLTTLVRILRALDLLEVLERLITAPAPSPIELLRMHGRTRRRASGVRSRGATSSEQAQDIPWRWGDEASDEHS